MSVGFLIFDGLAQVLDSKLGESRGVVVTKATHDDDAVFGLHRDSQLLEQVSILAQKFANASERENARNRRRALAARSCMSRC